MQGRVYQTATALHLMQPVACTVRAKGMKKSSSCALLGHALGHVQLFFLCTARLCFLPGQAVLAQSIGRMMKPRSLNEPKTGYRRWAVCLLGINIGYVAVGSSGQSPQPLRDVAVGVQQRSRGGPELLVWVSVLLAVTLARPSWTPPL